MAGTRVQTVVASLAALILGGLAAFLTAGPALFADGSLGERILVLGISVFAFALIGLALGSFAPHAWRWIALCAWAPLVVVLVFLGGEAFSRVDTALLWAGFALGDVAAVLAGALLGSRLRTRRA